MKLHKLEIFNFKSIEHVAVTFPQLFAFVGPNNVGKSTILETIKICLSRGYPSLVSSDPADFYKKNTGEPIKIYLQFSNLTDDEKRYFRANSRRVMKVNGGGSRNSEYLTICLERKFNEPGAFYFVGEDYQPIHYPGEDNPIVRKLAKGDRELLPLCIAIPEFRDSSRYFSDSVKYEWGQLLNTVRSKLNSNVAIKTSIGSLQELISEDQEIIKLNASLKELMLEFLTDNFNNVDTSISPIDPADLLKSASLLIDDGISTTLDNHGAGVRSLAVIALIILLASTEENIIITLEEPELFLHPTALYVLNEAMQKRSTKTQVIYSSHSPFLINVTKPRFIGRVYKTTNGTQVKQLPDLSHWMSILGEDEVERDIDAQRNQLFFARSVVLVEGPTEELSLPVFASKLGVNLNKKGVTLIEVNGKPNLKRYSEYLSDFGIPHVIVYDVDRVDLAINETIENLPVDKYPMNLDFEEMLTSIPEQELDRLLVDAYGDSYSKYKSNPIVNRGNPSIKDIQLRFLRKSKPFASKYIAQKIRPDRVPGLIKTVIEKAVQLASS